MSWLISAGRSAGVAWGAALCISIKTEQTCTLTLKLWSFMGSRSYLVWGPSTRLLSVSCEMAVKWRLWRCYNTLPFGYIYFQDTYCSLSQPIYMCVSGELFGRDGSMAWRAFGGSRMCYNPRGSALWLRGCGHNQQYQISSSTFFPVSRASFVFTLWVMHIQKMIDMIQDSQMNSILFVNSRICSQCVYCSNN